MPTSSGNSIARTSIQDFTKNPRKTYFLITGIVAIIALLHLLPAATQQDLAQLFNKQPWLLGVGLVIVMGFTYFNWLAGLLVLFLLICVTFPMVPFKLNYKPTGGGLNSSETSVPRHSDAQPEGWAYNRVSTV